MYRPRVVTPYDGVSSPDRLPRCTGKTPNGSAITGASPMYITTGRAMILSSAISFIFELPKW